MDKKTVVGLLAGVGTITVAVAAARKLNKLMDECEDDIFDDDIFEDDDNWYEDADDFVRNRIKAMEDELTHLRKQRDELLYAVYVELPQMYRQSEEEAVKKALEEAAGAKADTEAADAIAEQAATSETTPDQTAEEEPVEAVPAKEEDAVSEAKPAKAKKSKAKAEKAEEPEDEKKPSADEDLFA